jgi:hypothetical protein
MKRPTIIVFALFAAAAVLWIGLQRGQEGAAGTHRAGRTTHAVHELDGGPSPSGEEDSVAPGEGDDGVAADRSGMQNDAGGALLDGGDVPELVTDAPKSVIFGVVLVQYAGAQGAPPGTRSREQARALAGTLRELAKEDFGAAVDKGDPGSTKNAGRMFRGVLEPAPEFVLFSLDEDEVSEPVDTPRGFWIVKRVD